MLNGHHFTGGIEAGHLVQQPSFDMDNDYGFFEMDDLEEMTGTPRETMACEENDRSVVDESSQILTPSIVEQLPLDVHNWECLFSTTIDGPSFGTFMRNVRGHTRTIAVAKTEDGQIYGAYATDPWSGRGRVAARGGDTSFLFGVSQGSAKKGQMSPLAHPSSQASLGSFIPGLDMNLMSTSPTSAIDFNMANLSVSPKRAGASIDIVKSTSTTCGFKQVCQLGNKFIGMSDGEASFTVESSFTRVSTQSTSKDRKEFDIVEFEVYGLNEG
ncbi:hypothetical protein ACHAWO_010741 [Cyclotella atomus]|uniref:Oxidation resistance protein 1 n=1 Tax=Cyclotella atomus TaxID=382360 RepID=A0ABD3P1J0_9STRA